MGAMDAKKTKRLYVLAGVCLLGIGLAALTIPLWYHIAELDQDAAVERYLERGQLYLAEGDYEAAKIELRNVLQLDPRNARAYLHLAQLFLATENFAVAVYSAQQAVELEPKGLETQLMKGRIALLSRQHEAALGLAQSVLQDYPETVEAHNLRVQAALIGENLDLALGAVEEALGLFPDELLLVLLEARVHFARADTLHARDLLEGAVSRFDSSLAPVLALSNLWRATGDSSRALATLKSAESSHSDVPAFHLALGAHYRGARRFDEAEEAFKRAVEVGAADSHSYFVLGEFYTLLGRKAEAVAAYEAALDANPYALAPKKRLAYAYLDQGRYSVSDSLADLILEGAPNDLDGRFVKGQILLAREGTGHAARMLEEVRSRTINAGLEVPGRLHYSLALAYNTERRFPESLAAAFDIEEVDTYYAPGQLLAAESFLRAGEYRQAVRSAEQALQLLPSSLTARLLLAEALAGTDNWEQKRKGIELSIQALRAAVQVDSGNMRARLDLAHALWVDDQTAEATAEFVSTAEDFSDSAFAQMALGAFYQRQGDKLRAAEVFENVVARFDSLPEAHTVLAAFRFANGEREVAGRSFRRAVKVAPKDPQALTLLGKYQAFWGHSDSARVLFARARVLAPDYKPPIRQWAYQHLVDGDLEAAETLADSILAGGQEDPGGFYVRGRARLLQGKVGPSVQDLDRLSWKYPDYDFPALQPPRPLAYYLAQAYHLNGQPRRALEALEKLPAVWVATSDYRLLRAEILTRMNKNQEASDLVEDVLRVGNAPLATRLLLGNIYYRASRLDEALATFRKVLEDEPDNRHAQYALGLVYARQERQAEALAAFEKVLDQYPDQIEPLERLVYYELAMGNPDRARARVKAQLARLPENGWLHFMLADLLEKEGRLTESLPHLERAVALNPGHVEAQYRLGVYYHTNGRQDEATTAYRRVMTLEPLHASAANGLASMLVEDRKDLDEAWKLALLAVEQEPKNADFLGTLGLVYLRNESLGLAVEILEKSVALDPDDPQKQLHLGMAQARRGKSAAADSILRQVLLLDPSTVVAEEARRELAALEVEVESH